MGQVNGMKQKTPGRGRPSLSAKDKRGTLSVRIHPQARRALEILAKAEGVSMGEVIENLLLAGNGLRGGTSKPVSLKGSIPGKRGAD